MTRGWMDGIEHIESLAVGYSDVPAGSMLPLAVMSHIMQGYQRTMIQWAQERPPATQKSAHFSIGRDGRIVQHASIFTPTWTAGRVNAPTWALLPAGANPNKHIVGIEHEGFSEEPSTYGHDYIYDDEHPWSDAMVLATGAVHEWIFEQVPLLVPSEDTVIGHFMVDASTRSNDPGDQWPRQKIIDWLAPTQTGKPEPLSTLQLIRYALSGSAHVNDMHFTPEPYPTDRPGREYHRLDIPRRQQ